MRQNIQELVDAGYVGSLFDELVQPLESTVEKLSILDEPSSLDFSKEWYYCASGNAIRNHLPCDECIRSEPREEIHCIRFFKLHPCAYFNSAHCNGSTCEYWDHKTIACTYGPYLAWLAATSVPVADAPTVKGIRMPEYSFTTGAKFGEKPEHTEAEAHGDDLCLGCLCHTCDFSPNICKSCEDPAACATRGKHTVACPEFSGLKKPPRNRKKPVKAKKQPKALKHSENYCVLRGGDCSVHNGCQNGDVPCTLKDVPHLEEIHLPCEVHALLDLAVKPAKEPSALLLDGKWYSDGKMLWDCSDCLCLDCANEGKSCHDCKGFERCLKIGGTGGKIGACPDFRTEEGKEQHCLENGCLCFKCQLIGEDHCEKCPGPIRCKKPRTKCTQYIGAETDHIRLTVSPDKES